MFGSRRFGDQQLERLYQTQHSFHSASLILHAISVLVAAFLLLAVNHLFKPDLALLLWLVGASSESDFKYYYTGEILTKKCLSPIALLFGCFVLLLE
jgi:hypothetical protein